jgi:hypothetical protein
VTKDGTATLEDTGLPNLFDPKDVYKSRLRAALAPFKTHWLFPTHKVIPA